MPSTRRLPSLNALRSLEAVRETGSISAAAVRLSVSHSAVSHQIRHLEDWIGRPITVRRGRTVALTEAGESLARVVHDSFDAIRHEMDLLPLRFARAVSISALPVISEHILLPSLNQFRIAHPELSLHISLAQTDRPKTPAPDIEILLQRRNRVSDPDTVLLPGDAIPVCAPSVLLAADGDPAVALQTGPLLADEDSRMWSEWFTLSQTDVPAQASSPMIYLEGSFLLQKAAEAGVGIALCRKCTITQALRSGRLVALSDVAIDRDWAYTVQIAAGREIEPELQIVLSWLKRTAQDAAPTSDV